MNTTIRDNPSVPDNPEKLRDIAAIVLDVDGTLYEQGFVRRKMASELIRAYAFRPLEGYAVFRFLKTYRNCQESLRGVALPGQPAEAQLSAACQRSGTDRQTAHAYLDRWFWSAPLKHVRAAVRPGITEFLLTMKSRGIKLGVLSDYPAHAKLEVLGVLNYFDSIVGPCDLGVKGFKPDPSGLLLCARNLGVKPQRVLYVGDRPETDARCARRAAAFAAIIGEHRFQDASAPESWHEVASFASLLTQLQRPGALA